LNETGDVSGPAAGDPARGGAVQARGPSRGRRVARPAGGTPPGPGSAAALVVTVTDRCHDGVTSHWQCPGPESRPGSRSESAEAPSHAPPSPPATRSPAPTGPVSGARHHHQ
jgi:hypothetical protein